jgi:hypothetical protein
LFSMNSFQPNCRNVSELFSSIKDLILNQGWY